jgi:putative sterol carrier protein
VLRYLSDEWVEEFDHVAEADPTLQAASKGVSVTVQHVISGGPEGERAYHVVVDDGRVRIRPGQLAAPTLTFRGDYATSAAIARGELSAQGAFGSGQLRVGGDLSVLIEQQAVFASFDAATESLRGRTEY